MEDEKKSEQQKPKKKPKPLTADQLREIERLEIMAKNPQRYFMVNAGNGPVRKIKPFRDGKWKPSK